MRRTQYIARRTVGALITIVVAITLNFFLFRLAPGDPAAKFARIPGITPAQLAALHHRFGLDQPLITQYFLYLRELTRGDLGYSFSSGFPVGEVLLQAYQNTIPMVLLGVIVALVLGVLTGMLTAWRRRTAADYLGVGVAITLYSLPTQFVGLMLIFLSSAVLPTGGMVNDFLLSPTPLQHLADVLQHMILPSTTLGLALLGQYALVTRSTLLETLGEDYILAARAKGLRNWAIMRRHALRNAMLPLISLVALSFGFLVAGAVLVETVFSWPGIGRLIYQSVLQRDWPVLQSAFLVLTVSVIFFNYLADLSYAWFDPRITR